MRLTGHRSVAVNSSYTNLKLQTLQQAIQRVPSDSRTEAELMRPTATGHTLCSKRNVTPSDGGDSHYTFHTRILVPCFSSRGCREGVS